MKNEEKAHGGLVKEIPLKTTRERPEMYLKISENKDPSK